jgi:hypothetical protein
MDGSLETFVPLQFKRKKGQWLARLGDVSPTTFTSSKPLLGHMYWHSLLDSGAFKGVVEIARAEGLMPTTVGRLLRLARLAPDIVEQFMMGLPATKADAALADEK